MRIKSLTSLIFLGLLWNSNSQNTPLRVYDLKSEYLVNPIGIDVKTPRLSWKIYDQRRGARSKSLQNLCGNRLHKSRRWKRFPLEYRKNQCADHQMVMPWWKNITSFPKSIIGPYPYGTKTTKRFKAVHPLVFEDGWRWRPENWTGSWISDSRDINKKESPYFRKRILTSKRK